MKNDTIFVKPEDFIWDSVQREIRGKINGINFFVPTSELCLQSLRWDKTDFPREIQRVVENGFDGVVQTSKNGELIVSIREWQSRAFEQIEEGMIYQGSIMSVAPDAIFVDVNTLSVRVYATECSRARMNNVQHFFKPGDKVKVKIVKKDKDFPFHISGSRKEAYPSIAETTHNYEVGQYIYVKTCERLNNDGYWVEVTPSIPGILNGPEELLDLIHRGERIKVRIIKVDELGIKCKIAKWRLIG